MAAKRKRKQTLNQFIINKFLGKEIWKNKIFIAREMKFTKDLIKKYPLKAFWQALPPKFDTDSLAWFIGAQGKTYLEIEYAKFKLDLKTPPRYDLNDTKQDEDKKVERKLRSVTDFIKYAGKKENES